MLGSKFNKGAGLGGAPPCKPRTTYRRSTKTRAPRKRTFIANMCKHAEVDIIDGAKVASGGGKHTARVSWPAKQHGAFARSHATELAHSSTIRFSYRSFVVLIM